MFRTRREMGIDLFTASDLRRYYTKTYERKQPLPVAIAIGVHAFEHMAAAYKAPAGLNEMEIAGGLRGEPAHLVRAKTVDVMVPANAEIVLEGELLPNGWTADEGPFGEFAGMQGDLKHNPLFRVGAITHRRNPIFYALQMPWENDWLERAGDGSGVHARARAGRDPGCRRARNRRADAAAGRWSRRSRSAPAKAGMRWRRCCRSRW